MGRLVLCVLLVCSFFGIAECALGEFVAYGWAPENRQSSVADNDDYRLIRMRDTNLGSGAFQETIKLFPVTDTGGLSSVDGFGFKRYGIQTTTNHMVTVQVINNGRCPVYMTMIGFRNETHRDILGSATSTFWGTRNPNLVPDRFKQPIFRLNQGVFTALGGVGLSVDSTVNWFGSALGPSTDDFTIYEGKFVDGADEDSSFVEYSRLPIVVDPATGVCTEMPSSHRRFFSLDIAHVSDTRLGSSVMTTTDFPGAYNTDSFVGCTTTSSFANVTVTIRFVDMRLYPEIPFPTTSVIFPNAELPRTLALGLTASIDANPNRFRYAGTITIARAAAADEVRIREYRVYSIFTSNGLATGEVRKCTGRIVVQFTVAECNLQATAATTRTCSKTILPSDSLFFQDELNPATTGSDCSSFLAISANEFGEDSLTFYNLGTASTTDLPVADFVDNTSVSGKDDESDEKDDRGVDFNEQPIETNRGTRKYVDDTIDRDLFDSNGSGVKFVAQGDATVNWLTDGRQGNDEGGRWFRRSIDGLLVNRYLTNKATVEQDNDIMGSAFNVPYHRWTFAPSEMSAWSMQVTNLQQFNATKKEGIRGFAVMPIDVCIARSANGSNYLNVSEIKNLAEARSDDDLFWFDMTTDLVKTWSEPCFNRKDVIYQVVLAVESGFFARYNILFFYQDFIDQTVVSSDSTTYTFRGCVMKGQDRDFFVPYAFPFTIVDAQITEGVDVDGMYIQYSAGAATPATQSRNVASDFFVDGWSSRLSASVGCPSSLSQDQQAGNWSIRVFKESDSSLSDTRVEFTLVVKLGSLLPPVEETTDPALLANLITLQPGNFTGYLSNGADVIYQFQVPANQQLIVKVTETSGDLDSVTLQPEGCPDPIVPCGRDPTVVCFVDFNLDKNNIFNVRMPLELISASEKSWYVMVKAKDRQGQTITDEGAFLFEYNFAPLPPPSASPIPSRPPCGVFETNCNTETEWIESSAHSAVHLISLVLALIASMFALL